LLFTIKTLREIYLKDHITNFFLGTKRLGSKSFENTASDLFEKCALRAFQIELWKLGLLEQLGDPNMKKKMWRRLNGTRLKTSS
jgi:hypothetical protein